MPRGKDALTPPLDGPSAARVSCIVDRAFAEFHGQIDELEGAIGMFMLGRHLGWRALVLIHNKRTVRKYEEILGISIRDEFPEEGPDWDRSKGYVLAKKLSNFWKAVSGEERIDDRRELS